MILGCLRCHELAYAITANGVCLHLLVPQHCTSWCFLHSLNKWAYFRETTNTLQQLHSKKRGGIIFKGGLIFGRSCTSLTPKIRGAPSWYVTVCACSASQVYMGNFETSVKVIHVTTTVCTDHMSSWKSAHRFLLKEGGWAYGRLTHLSHTQLL